MDADSLVRNWRHSHEEDSGDNMVFRPLSFPFPPSRGRRGFDLAAGGAMTMFGPGPDDRSNARRGSWAVRQDSLVLNDPEQGAQEMQIVSASPDKLVLKRDRPAPGSTT